MLRKHWADRADFEPLHLALSSLHRLMRILGAIVLSELCSCVQVNPRRLNAEAYERSLSVTSRLRDEPFLLEQLSH